MASNPADYFENVVPGLMDGNPDLVESINAVYRFIISGEEGGVWIADFTVPEIRQDNDDDVGCTVEALDIDFMRVVNGENSPVEAFSSGQLKVGGDLMVAMKLTELLSARPAKQI